MLDLLPFEVLGVVVRHTSQAAALVEALQPDLVVSFSFPLLIDSRTVNAARVAVINVHGGRLPQYRGPNPMWAIYRGESEIDVTVHRIASQFDTGDVLAVTATPLDSTPTPERVLELWSASVPPTLDAAVDRVLSGEPGWPQPAGNVDILPCLYPRTRSPGLGRDHAHADVPLDRVHRGRGTGDGAAGGFPAYGAWAAGGGGRSHLRAAEPGSVLDGPRPHRGGARRAATHRGGLIGVDNRTRHDENPDRFQGRTVPQRRIKNPWRPGAAPAMPR